MIHTILVPLDGSQLAEQALPEARRIAQSAEATIVLLRVARLGTVLQDQLAAQLASIDQAEEYLRIKARELSSAGFGVRTEVFCNDPAEGISIAAMVHAANLIVMSTHGRSGLGRALLGSVAEQVLHESSLPVLLVRGVRPAGQNGPYRKILVPLDGTTLAEGAVHFLAGEQFARDADIVLLEVVSAEAEPAEHRRAEAQRHLYNAALRYLDGRRWDSQVEIGRPAEQIVQVARDAAVDAIVMATHGRIGVDRLIHGSVAAAVLRHAGVPLLLLPAGSAAVSLTEDPIANAKAI